jgi:outer membrane protein assembly factor BamA
MSVMPGPERTARRRLTPALVALSLALMAPAFSGSPSLASSFQPEVKFDGLKRTKPQHLRSLLDECLEEQGVHRLAAVDQAELDQCLMNSELFSAVSSSIDDVISVTVKERWTLIPLPYFRSQEDSTSVGAFLMESNFLGRGQLLVLGATFGSLGNSYFFVHRDPSVAGTNWISRLMYIQDQGDIFLYEGDEKAGGYYQKEKTFSIAPGYEFTPSLEGNLILGYTDRDFDDAESFGTVPEPYHFWSAGIGLELDRTDFKFYFREGHKVELEILHQFARSGDGDPAPSWQFRWDWHRTLIGRNVAKLNVESVGIGSDSVVDSFKVGGHKALRGVQDKGLWAQYLAGAVLDYHLPLREGRFGTWAAGPFLSYALYRPPGGLDANGWQDTVAYGVGLFYYLRKIAFPGIGIIVGKNEDFSGNFVSVQIGFSR